MHGFITFLIISISMVIFLSFMLVLGYNLGVGQSYIHGADEACQMIRIQLIDCSSMIGSNNDR